MDKKPPENKTIKTIVPIKGNLLEKIKNKLKNNGTSSQTSEGQARLQYTPTDVLNNNKHDSTKIPKIPASNKKKIEIQKIEKVNLEINDLIKATRSEPIKRGRNVIIREASPKPEPSKVVENDIKSCDPEIITEPVNNLPIIAENNTNCEKVQIDGPCTSKSLQCSTNIQEKPVENENTKNDEILNNVSEEEEEGDLMDIGEEEWLHDINVMIGETRIREIDQSLKKIPTTVTGNRIQTENVELKLIINHLLEKLNAKSVIETVENAPSSLFNSVKDSKTDYSDSFDEMPSDFYDEQSDFDASTNIENSTKTNEDQNSFSVPVENSVAIITIPALEEPPKSDNLIENEELLNLVVELPIKVEENVENNVQQSKKRRGRPPLAASTAKKTKLSTIKSTKPEKEDSPELHPRKLSLRKSSSRESSVESNKGDSSVTKTISLPPMREKNNETTVKRNSSRERLLKTAIEKDIESKNKKVTRVQELKSSKNESSAIIKRSVTSSESSFSSSDCENDNKGKLRPRKSKISPNSSQKITDFFKKEKEEIITEQIITENLKPSKNIQNKSSKNVESSKILDEKLSKIEKSSNIKNKKSSKTVKKINGQNKSTTLLRKRKIISDSDSECEPLINKQSELKSVTPNDFNLQTQSTIIERYDYLNKSSSSFADKPKNEKNVITSHPICAELKDIVDKSKGMDPTYLKPPEITKRPYLRTSAFKGNHINSDDSSHSIDSSTRQPSVSCDDLPTINNNNNINKDKKNGQQNVDVGIKDRMKELINKQKEKIQLTAKNNETSINTEITSPDNTREAPILDKKKKLPEIAEKMSAREKNRRRTGFDVVNKKVFEQGPVEKAIEKLVCYDEIIEAIRITDPPRKKGRASSNVKPLEIEKKKEIEEKLKKVENFKCGSCNNLVTKHKWKDHVIEHGGMAWIESFESRIDINDWNESVRRLNNYMRIYKFESYTCPNCGLDKRSALGHLSHFYVCGEDEETIESRKTSCEFCGERVLPYNMSFHRKKCKVINKVETEKIEAEDGDDEEENDDENSRDSTTQDGGRLKRKAGKKAVRKVKTFLKELNEDPMDQIIKTVNGQFICNHCGEKFDVREKAVEHLDKVHADQKECGDFDASSSDACVNEDESSETDGSSGVESSDIQSVNEEDEEICDSNNISDSKGRKSWSDSLEIRNGRKVIGPYTETYHNAKIFNKTFKLTKEFINDNICDNILTEFSPKYKICENANLASYLTDLKFGMKSMKFSSNIKDDYSSQFGVKRIKEDWNELDFGNFIADKNSLTLYCGGSVSSLDWSQSNDGKNFLAIACNSTKDKNTDLEETSQTCIQIYQFEHLVNEKFSSFTNTSKFLYLFFINEGPVWSIKFHPFIVPNKERIGLLAVTSSNHHIYIFSLPYLENNGNSPLLISLEPLFICKTVDDFWLFQEKYLMQATVVSWFYQKEYEIQLLGAGFINGMVSIWNFNDIKKSEDNEETVLFPYMTFQPHRELITSIDFKHMLGTEIHLLTTSLDRGTKVFVIDNTNYHEVASYYASSRLMCGEWWLHWPGFITGNDNCYSHGSLLYRQPLEFGSRQTFLFHCNSSITTCNLNHWLNAAIFATDAGDVMLSNPSQLLAAHPKDRWTYFRNNILSYTDIVELEPASNEHGIVFYDLKSKARKPKEFRSPPSSDNINQLQINQISFNRNEMSYRFYALAYETGFVRIRHLKNSK